VGMEPRQEGRLARSRLPARSLEAGAVLIQSSRFETKPPPGISIPAAELFETVSSAGEDVRCLAPAQFGLQASSVDASVASGPYRPPTKQ
jgi:hypothetical protein